MGHKRGRLHILSISSVAFLFGQPAIALPFKEDAYSFERYVNALWKQGGSSTVKLGGSLESNNPQDRRLYHGFYGCESNTYNPNWSPIFYGNSVRIIGFERTEQDTFECRGYVDRFTPTGNRRCETRIEYKDIYYWKKDSENSSQYLVSRDKLLTEGPECKIYF